MKKQQSLRWRHAYLSTVCPFAKKMALKIISSLFFLLIKSESSEVLTSELKSAPSESNRFRKLANHQRITHRHYLCRMQIEQERTFWHKGGLISEDIFILVSLSKDFKITCPKLFNFECFKSLDRVKKSISMQQISNIIG